MAKSGFLNILIKIISGIQMNQVNFIPMEYWIGVKH